MCKNYIPCTSQSKPTPGTNINLIDTSTAASEKTNTFVFKPNFNINPPIDTTQQSNEEDFNKNEAKSRMNVPTNGVDSCYKENKFNTNVPKNGHATNKYAKYLDTSPSPSVAQPTSFPNEGFNGIPKTNQIPSNGSSLSNGGFNGKPTPNQPCGTYSFNQPKGLLNGKIMANGMKRKIPNAKDDNDGREDPFSFANYYKQQESIGRQETEKRGDSREDNQVGE